MKFSRVPPSGAIHDLEHIWNYALPPYRMAPHVYGVGGNNDVSVYLLDSGEGLILLDTGMRELLYLIVDSIHRLGFDPRDIRAILLSHGHGDHCNGAMPLHALSGAEIWLSAVDERFYQQHPIAELGVVPFPVHHHYTDGGCFSLGRFQIRTRFTPGHTPGTTSFFFTDTDETTGRTYRLAMHGGVGIDTMRPAALAALDLPQSLAHTFVRTCRELAREPVDICLPSHLNQINLAANLPEDPMDFTPFVDPEVWPALMADRAEAVMALYPSVYQN
ncbi:MBL fold metallo-hydrolase [uncultured Flavonifractor sp.]|uniref:MBL fold metallo-hydrolase n=1 Tax=uncultured Flavonifractor sp. TaxID=1193534 RepID=UPI00261352B9|nr:MBL fold metallo-hydrolase [uncultured Flavonifractor sp.]